MSLNPTTLKALHVQWRKLSPSLTLEPPPELAGNEAERWVRLKWTNGHLHSRRLDQGKDEVKSWNELSEGEAKHLLKLMREESGDGPAYRALLMGRLAVDLWGSDWDHHLRERLRDRFFKSLPEDLEPAEAHTMIEELLGRIARRDQISIEAVRANFRGRGKVAA